MLLPVLLTAVAFFNFAAAFYPYIHPGTDGASQQSSNGKRWGDVIADGTFGMKLHKRYTSVLYAAL